jgi:hypothetical protein
VSTCLEFTKPAAKLIFPPPVEFGAVDKEYWSAAKEEEAGMSIYIFEPLYLLSQRRFDGVYGASDPMESHPIRIPRAFCREHR